MSFISYLINGISLGSVYAIIALGYTMVYGIAKMLNFAHGDVIMIGAYVVMAAMTGMGLHPAVAIILAAVFCTASEYRAFGVWSQYHIFSESASPSGNFACGWGFDDYGRSHCYDCFVYCDYGSSECIYP